MASAATRTLSRGLVRKLGGNEAINRTISTIAQVLAYRFSYRYGYFMGWRLRGKASSLRDISAAYKVLGVRPGASKQKIKRAYHQKARPYHPDSSAPNKEKFIEITDAYELLTDKAKGD